MQYTGLSSSEAQRRLLQDGPNIIPRALAINKWKLIFSQINSFFIYILLVAFVLSAFLGEWIDAWVILGAIVINTSVGFWQEYKAYNTLVQLTQMLPWQVLVIRDDKEKLLEAKDLVYGDIVIIQAGDKIPADMKLLESDDLFVDEAVLTGESEPVVKHAESYDKKSWKLYMGTTAIKGRGVAEIMRIGSQTKFGQIAHLIQSQSESYTPLQKELNKLSRYIGFGVIALSTLLWFVGIATGFSVWDMFFISVAVAISAVPEGLVVSMTAMLALGMQKLLKKKALVRRLVSAETLGSVDVICTDKTGTLTEGKAQVVKALMADGLYNTQNGADINNPAYLKLVEVATLSNTAKFISGKLIGGSLNQAMFRFGAHYDIHKTNLEDEKYRYVDSVPFQSKYKYALYLYENKEEKQRELFYMGMPEKLLDLSSHYLNEKNELIEMTAAKRTELRQQYLDWAKKGYRILGTGYKIMNGGKSLIFNNGIFLGFLLLRDPLRAGVDKMIQVAREGGIKVIMITGDHPETARAVGQQLGLIDGSRLILTGEDMDNINDDDLADVIEQVAVFARVKPTDKWRIVKTLQAKGHKVAMTGDGINDAPAIKAADIGIAVNSGTEVTKEVADLVLLDNNFNVIVASIEEGRSIFLNLKKIIVYLLADSFTEIILILGAMALGLPLPLTAIQILWINLAADGFPGIALTFETNEDSDLMNASYLKGRYRLLDKEMIILIFIIGILTDVMLLGLFYYVFNTQGLILAQTFVFAAHATDSLLYVFSCKNLHKSLFHTKIFDNKYLLGAVGIGFSLTAVVLFTPLGRTVFGLAVLPLKDWGLLFLVGVVEVFLIETVKHFFITKPKTNKS